MSNADPHRLILTGENPFLRHSASDGGPVTTNASFWRILLCPKGPGHVLYLKSELTADRWRIYADNLAMARWLQQTVQGHLNAELKDTDIPVTEAQFSRTGDPNLEWTERVTSRDEEISLTWHDLGAPMLVHTHPDAAAGRPYGVCTVLVPAAATRLCVNGVQAAGRSWPMAREDRPSSNSCLAFSESWTETP